MKRFLRIIVPIIMILAILACAAWYLFVYDREFTRDMLLSSARFFEDSGSPNVSAWLYDLAYRHSSHEPQIAIELARKYKEDDNYTKAEYTLTSAIAETSAPELYVELCATFVEQDKLLDAVTLLDSIHDPDTKAALDAMRPAAPVLTPQNGFYSQYIKVDVEQSSHTIYMMQNNYPTTSVPYSGAIELPAGESTVYALAVNDSLLVSTLAASNYTIGGIVEKVEFHDDTLEEMIRKQLMVADDTELYTNDLWSITDFTVPAEVTDCRDIALLTHLRSLVFRGKTDTDLSFLQNMPDLEVLSITESKLDENEIAAIGCLTMLQELTLSDCGITSISAFKDLHGLQLLDLSGNSIRNISTLSAMTGMKKLNLSGNALTDIGALASLDKLTELNVSHNSILSLEPIRIASSLYHLDASFNQLTEVGCLADLHALRTLSLDSNSLLDISALASCPQLTYVSLSNNLLTDISVIGNLTKLQKLYFAYNQVTELPVFVENSPLVTIDASHNQLTSLDNLEGLLKLNDVFVDYNEKLKSLKPLDSCPILVLVNAYGTLVSDVTFLTEKDVLVNYDPTATR